MPRYFLEVAYRGTNYSGFQVQQNANSIQAEVEKAFQVLQRKEIALTGSSRTDAGVHAIQNYFHFDFDGVLDHHFSYKINAILPRDIMVRSCREVAADAHCRFDAESRDYKYVIYNIKDPFLEGRAFYFPYRLDLGILQSAAAICKEYSDFTSFSKRNSQARSFLCRLMESRWESESGAGCLVYRVRADRFLRGMVRALVATMLQVARHRISLDDFRKVIEAKDCTKASFAVPGEGLFLMRVNYPLDYFDRGC